MHHWSHNMINDQWFPLQGHPDASEYPCVGVDVGMCDSQGDRDGICFRGVMKEQHHRRWGETEESLCTVVVKKKGKKWNPEKPNTSKSVYNSIMREDFFSPCGKNHKTFTVDPFRELSCDWQYVTSLQKCSCKIYSPYDTRLIILV